MALPITQAVPIGSHMSVPIRLPDGRAYGMFCCINSEADRSLNQRDLQMMKAFAELTAFEINRNLEASNANMERLARIMNAIDERQLSIVYQPICDIETRRPIGLECLARFSAEPYRSPDIWFAEAAQVSLGASLELTAIEMALAALPRLPAGAYLTLNASPATILSREFRSALDGISPERIVLEVTEHAQIDDYASLLRALDPLRQAGLRLAVDDAGAGYCSLQHILHLHPDLIKLDMSLTRNIEGDATRRALASALIAFARETGSQIIAEGVETLSELKTLQALGVEVAQGYFLGRPMALDSALKLFDRNAEIDLRVA
jgi:EAL domain-containing protein (putative c-di-GMP-specific phosphodiesterase class I)